MAEPVKKNCQSCGCEVLMGESYVLNGRTLCEDCYLEEKYPVRTCDPWPAYAAKRLKTSDERARAHFIIFTVSTTLL
jgi:hypothetical protein